MNGYPITPGVLDVGHMTGTGCWHPGAEAHCLQCNRPTLKRRDPEPVATANFRIYSSRNQGSDCRTGKVQFVTRAAAQAAAASLRKRDGHPPAPFRCTWCGCWHNGNQRGRASKARAR